MTDEQIKHMVNRLLMWRLPEDFNPDGGISFKRYFNECTDHPMRHEPVGTNLLDYTQAEQMVRYMVEGLAAAPAPPSREWIPVSGRLPEYSGDVIGCWWGGSVAIANLICGEWWYVSHSSGRIKANVAPDYWQPLPAPPVADSGASAREEKHGEN